MFFILHLRIVDLDSAFAGFTSLKFPSKSVKTGEVGQGKRILFYRGNNKNDLSISNSQYEYY